MSQLLVPPPGGAVTDLLGPLEQRGFDVVLVTQLGGGGCLLGRGGVESLHLQSCTETQAWWGWGWGWRWVGALKSPAGEAHTPMERILAWLGAWALGFSFFFSSSAGFSFTSFTGALLSSFFFFFSEGQMKSGQNLAAGGAWILPGGRGLTCRGAAGEALGADRSHPPFHQDACQLPHFWNAQTQLWTTWRAPGL